MGTSANALKIQIWTAFDRSAPAQVPATRLLWLVLVQSGGLATATTLRPPRLAGMAPPTFPASARPAAARSHATAAADPRRGLNSDSTVPDSLLTCFVNRGFRHPKPFCSNTPSTGPPLIWTAVVRSRRCSKGASRCTPTRSTSMARGRGGRPCSRLRGRR